MKNECKINQVATEDIVKISKIWARLLQSIWVRLNLKYRKGVRVSTFSNVVVSKPKHFVNKQNDEKQQTELN